jgi:hypothetical protein
VEAPSRQRGGRQRRYRGRQAAEEGVSNLLLLLLHDSDGKGLA